MTDTEKPLAVVTGGAGFIGSHLCERLVSEGYRVISLDNYFTGSVANHVAGVEYRTGHTKDIAIHIPETPDLLFHLGEYARTEKSFEDIEIVWDANKIGTFAVLEFCRRQQCKLIYAGSSTKFADEGDGRNQSPYAWSKATNTELVKNYAVWFGLRYAITYFYNVYGPREMSGQYGTLIKIFTELTRHGQPLTVTMPGTQTRNYTHVSDIVDGLLLVGEKGQGDGYGIGADQSYSVLEIARMFGGEVMMMPERMGNRLCGGVDNAQVKALGWQQKYTIELWIKNVVHTVGLVEKATPRILVFSTTYLPDAGPAERALVDLATALPHVEFDIVTTVFSPAGREYVSSLPNVTLHRVGVGSSYDKYRLLFSGARLARDLQMKHSYIFAWSLFASYGAFAAVLARVGKSNTPLLITLADQKLNGIAWYTKFLLGHLLAKADQVYALDTSETRVAATLSKRSSLVRSIGDGDAFANQIRFAYAQFLMQRIHTYRQ